MAKNRTFDDKDRERVAQARGGQARERQDQGAALVHALAARKAKGMFVDLMASGGVGYNQIAKEVFFFLPQAFLDAYEQLWYKGLAGKDDGGTGARGAAQAATGELGKAPTRNVPGKIQISGGGAKRKTYKKYWVIADEDMLALKDLIDKRLRAMAREVQFEMAEIEKVRRGEGRSEGAKTVGLRCKGCGRVMREGWKFCPFDGHEVEGE